MEHNEDHILEYAGSFRLLRKIAVGGMATVYEAEQLGPAGFAKRGALKVIHPRYASERHWLQLFIDEAKLSANLAHGNIVQIYQLGEVDGQYYMAMEYIQGPTLRSIIDRHAELRQPMPLPIAAYIASRVCRALDYAHNFVAPGGQRLDVVHRDVSPQNVLVGAGLAAVVAALVGGHAVVGVEPVEGLLGVADGVPLGVGVEVVEHVGQAGVVVAVAGGQVAAEAVGDLVGWPVAELVAAPGGRGLQVRQQRRAVLLGVAVLLGGGWRPGWGGV